MWWILWAVTAQAGCGTSCPLPVHDSQSHQVQEIEASGVPYTVEIEVREVSSGRLVHSAQGDLVWGEKAHLGGQQHRGLDIDMPDYEVNSKLLAPDEIWTSI